MKKDHILAEIRRTAEGGKPLGMQRFSRVTGIRKADWLGTHWLRWGDALVEAGFQPNTFASAVPEEDLLGALAILTQDLGHFPIDAELKQRARSDRKFPSHSTFRRLGNKNERARALMAYCLKHGMDDVAALCAPIADAPESSPSKPDVEAEADDGFGFVYLLKSGRFYKIGRTNAPGRRERELAIQLPERATLMHEIKTDDPAGIEAYWHHRFRERRKNGEWFELTPGDVSAFRRRTFQ
jgi:hypothetical protein